MRKSAIEQPMNTTFEIRLARRSDATTNSGNVPRPHRGWFGLDLETQKTVGDDSSPRMRGNCSEGSS